MDIKLESSWKELLQDQFDLPYFQDLTHKVRDLYSSGLVYPPPKLIFNALDSVPVDKVKVVILGQDPYHGPNQAMGLSFSVPVGQTLPPSLANIYKEIEHDTGIKSTTFGDLTPWAHQGVLLLNSSLTVSAGLPLSHSKLGWHIFTDTIIERLATNRRNVIFMLWGNFARKKLQFINEENHLVLQSAHPSPLSAHHGFFGCQHFSKTNQYLVAHSMSPIVW